MEYTERKINSEMKFDGKVLKLYLDTVTLPNGQTAPREIIRHRGASAVLIINSLNMVYLCRQFRYTLNRSLLEIPAGKIEIGGSFEETALREAEEETGVHANKLIPLGKLIPTCGYSDEVIALYLIKDFEIKGSHLDDDEFLDIILLPFDELFEMVLSGEIEDAKTITAVLKYKALTEKGLI